MTSERGYLLDNRQSPAGVRLRALAELFDPATFRHLERIGVAGGWRCWEVGAGGPSVPRWLAQRVGPDGLVLATDIDTSWLGDGDGDGDENEGGDGEDGDGAGPPLQVRRHDVGHDDPPVGELDLVHARLVLTHVPARERALASMVAALRPGGTLLVEDADPGLQPLLCPDGSGPEQELANRLRHGFRTLLAGRDADLAFGRTLPRLLRGQGLLDVGAEGWFPITAPAAATLEIATVEQIRERLVEGGVASADEVDEHLDNVRAGRVPDLATSPMISAWGRRPSATEDGPPVRG